MATFESIINTVRDAAVATGQKASDFAAKTKVKIEIDAIEKKLAATFEGIGRMTYDTQKNGTDNADMIETSFKAVEALQEELDAMREKLAQMNGAVRCPDCETANDFDAGFCKKCGKSL